MSSTLVNGGCIVVAVLAVFGAANSYQTSRDYSGQYPDVYGGARAETRFAPLRERIPVNAEMGYFTDLDPSQAAAGGAFLAAQYAVAPRVLINLDSQGGSPGIGSPYKPEWAVGNFSRPQDFAAAGEARGYSLAGDLGNGVVLFRRKAS